MLVSGLHLRVCVHVCFCSLRRLYFSSKTSSSFSNLSYVTLATDPILLLPSVAADYYNIITRAAKSSQTEGVFASQGSLLEIELHAQFQDPVRRDTVIHDRT